MKTVSHSVLSVLLFMFSLFVVHDYLIETADADTQYELCYAYQDGKTSLDLPSQLHDHIHLVLDVPLPQSRLLCGSLIGCMPETTLTPPISHTSPVPSRPPLS